MRRFASGVIKVLYSAGFKLQLISCWRVSLYPHAVLLRREYKAQKVLGSASLSQCFAAEAISSAR